jgi:hypothetical protein
MTWSNGGLGRDDPRSAVGSRSSCSALQAGQRQYLLSLGPAHVAMHSVSQNWLRYVSKDMSADLFIQIRPRTATNTVTGARADGSTLSTDAVSTMSTRMPGSPPASGLTAPQQRPRLGRRITIGGGSDRLPPSNPEFVPSDQTASRASSRPGPGTRMSRDTQDRSNSNHGPGGVLVTRPSQRPYPPTSWKSSSTIDTLHFGTIDRSQGIDHQDNNLVGSNQTATVHYSFQSLDLAAATSAESASLTNRTAPTRESSRHRYTIRASSPTTPFRASSNRPSMRSRSSSNRADLPDPEMAYAHVFYYTTCLHSSPPRSRPLDTQPTLARYRDGLLLWEPPHLRSQSNDPPPAIYILEGACLDCDLSDRRKAETDLLDRYTNRIEHLTIQLILLQQDILEEHSPSLSHSNTITTFDLPSTLDLADDTTQGILDIEAQLADLINDRDRNVRLIWKGFTARWGPATIQAEQNSHLLEARARSRSTDRSCGSSASFAGPSDQQSPEKASLKSSATSEATHMMPDVARRSRSSSYATLTRASSAASPRGRYSDGTHAVFVDGSVDGVEEVGRMRLNWIRSERRDVPGPAVVGGRQSRQEG